MASAYKFDVNVTGLLCAPIKIDPMQLSVKIEDEAIIDYGAGICHMTYPLWCDAGFNKICYNENKELLSLMGVKSVEQMTFEKLPFQYVKVPTKVGNALRIPAYQFRLDNLILGRKTVGSEEIVLKNVTMRLINSTDSEFFIGLNVLTYLSVYYKPSVTHSTFQLMFEDSGKQLMEKHRISKGINNMQDTLYYIPEDKFKEVWDQKQFLYQRETINEDKEAQVFLDLLKVTGGMQLDIEKNKWSHSPTVKINMETVNRLEEEGLVMHDSSNRYTLK